MARSKQEPLDANEEVTRLPARSYMMPGTVVGRAVVRVMTMRRMRPVRTVVVR